MGIEADKVYGTVHVLSPKLKLKAIFQTSDVTSVVSKFCMIKTALARLLRQKYVKNMLTR